MKPIVIIESPLYAPDGFDLAKNVEYAIRCMRDSLKRGEAPFASHLLYSRGIAEAALHDIDTVADCTVGPVGEHVAHRIRALGPLDDANPDERTLGMEAGFAFHRVADRQAVYVDRGISGGMRAGIKSFLKANQYRGHRFVPDGVGGEASQCVHVHISGETCGLGAGAHAPLPVEFRSLDGLDVSNYYNLVVEPILAWWRHGDEEA